MKYNVFIDGQEGTTGLKIVEDLSKLANIEVMRIDADKRKNTTERSKLLNQADLVFLCLPDSAARESIELIKNTDTRVINTSTAFRTDNDWVFGLPEIKGQRELIRAASKVSVPGCHATGFILTIRPLIDAGLLQKDYPISCYSLTGYSGAGRSGIEEYENPVHIASKLLHAPKHYALRLDHKHLPEMSLYAGLSHEPLFTPVIANYRQGMAMTIPLISRMLPKKSTAQEIHEALTEYYSSEPFIHVMPFQSEAYHDQGRFDITACNHTNRLEIFVFGNNDNINIISRYDNLGKGASGAAIQNMNLMLGFDECNGLVK